MKDIYSDAPVNDSMIGWEGKPQRRLGRPVRETSLHSVMKRWQIGDSVVIPKTSKSNVYANCREFGQKAATKVITGTDTLRVWRIA